MCARKKSIRNGILALGFLFAVTACSTHDGPQFDYQIPEQIDNGLQVGSLVDVGMDEEKLEEAVVAISSGKNMEK